MSLHIASTELEELACGHPKGASWTTSDFLLKDSRPCRIRDPSASAKTQAATSLAVLRPVGRVFRSIKRNLLLGGLLHQQHCWDFAVLGHRGGEFVPGGLLMDPFG